MLLDKGALCIADLLHTYTGRLEDNLQRISRVPPTDVCSKRPSSASADADCNSLLHQFDTHEVSLIEALLHAISIFSSRSCSVTSDNRPTNTTTAGRIADRLKKYEMRRREYAMESAGEAQSREAEQTDVDTGLRKQRETNNCQSTDDGSSDERDDEVLDLIKLEGRDCNAEETMEPVTERDTRLYNSKTAILRRQIRVRLFEAGVLEAVGPWLACQQPSIMVRM